MASNSGFKKGAPAEDSSPAEALPKNSTYFDAMRTSAFTNVNAVADYVEFWIALKVDRNQDKWRIMHYMVKDLDQKDGLFKTENLCKDGDISFSDAVYQIAKFERTTALLSAGQTVNMDEKYPADKYPELQAAFFDVEDYRIVAHIEGIVFDKAGAPHRRIEGKVFEDASFARSEITESVLGVEQARENPKVAAKIEAGILSDVFNSVSARNASLDNILKVGQTLASLDEFATRIGAFYLRVQAAAGTDDKFDKLKNLTADEKKDLYGKASVLAKSKGPLLTPAGEHLDEAAKLGVHTEPFRKFIAECELYHHLLNASLNLKKLEEGFSSVGGPDTKLIGEIRKSVDAAQKKFLDLGGSEEQVDRLKAWVANPQKDPIPQWLPGFLDRYYEQRRNVMKKVKERQAGPREVNTMSAKVKPPVVE